MNTFSLAPLIIYLPLAGLLFNALIGWRIVDADRTLGERITGGVATLMTVGAFIVSVTLFISLATNGFEAWFVPMFKWIVIPAANFEVDWKLQIDTLSVTMMLVVSGVGSLIHIYALGYMKGDLDYSRFFVYFNLFIFFMLILVSGASYLMMFVGWEGVGLCSYLLISFWWYRVDKEGKTANATAGRKAMVMNRIGDFGVLIAMFLLFWTFGTLDYKPIFEGATEMFKSGQMVNFGGMSLSLPTVLTAVTLSFLLGVTGKSAQIPLYTWLPDAMAGPTPVSALIHAATMVTAGVYLLVRSDVLYEIVRESGALILGLISTPDLVAWIGALTAFFAGLIAFSQNDIKKVLAYSTVSQLGFMVAAAGMGAYVAAMFHLITHAFFKALLFLGSGSVIHGMEHGHHEVAHGDHVEDDGFDPQDMRYMGGLRHKMRTTYVVYLIGALALAGIFPLAGFWSKDEILLHAQTNQLPIFILLALAALGTAFYVGRQLIMVFYGQPRHAAAEHVVESHPLMTRPLIVLAGLTVVGGLLNVPYMTAAAAERAGMHAEGFWLALEQWLAPSVPALELAEEGVIHLPHTPLVVSPVVAGLSMALAVGGLALAWFVYRGRPTTYSEPDRLARTPIWWWSILPLNSLHEKILVPLFNRMAHWLAFKFDVEFWSGFLHDRMMRDMFVSFADFSSNVLDAQGVDGLVNGAGSMVRRVAGVLRLSQTGYARTYALAIFLGAVGLLVFFLYSAG